MVAYSKSPPPPPPQRLSEVQGMLHSSQRQLCCTEQQLGEAERERDANALKMSQLQSSLQELTRCCACDSHVTGRACELTIIIPTSLQREAVVE